MSRTRRHGAATSLLVAVTLSSALARAAGLEGSEALGRLFAEILERCPGAAALTYSGGGSERGEIALLESRQEVSPMSRQLGADRACLSPQPHEAEGLLVALGAAVVASDADACPVGLGAGVTLPVSDVNAVPDLQCPGCDGDRYVVADWRDVLRVLLAGMHHDAGADLAQRDCNSDVRRTLADRWFDLFGGCSNGACQQVRHILRPGDRAVATEVLLVALGLPAPPAAVFCNSPTAGPSETTPRPNARLTDFLDGDPIRRPCAAEDHVCRFDGTLGLVLPMHVPTNLPASVLHPTQPCSPGKMGFFPAPTWPSRCPNGRPPLFGKCFTPVDANGSPACLNTKSNCPGFGTPPGMDCRAYNLFLRKPDGGLQRDERNRALELSTFRARATSAAGATCAHAHPSTQLACHAHALGCALSVTGIDAENVAGTSWLTVDGVVPSLENVRKHVGRAPAPGAYPLVLPAMVNTLRGFDGLSSSVEGALAGCFTRQSGVEAAARDAGFVPLDAPPLCIDFDERACGATMFNQDACKKSMFELCPDFTSVIASPLETAVGGRISMSAAAHDDNDAAVEFVWQATAGQFDDATAASTSYVCTTEGYQTITVSVWDGRCRTDSSFLVRCRSMAELGLAR